MAIPGRASGDYEAVDAPMYSSPDLPRPRVTEVLPDEVKALWLRALERPEADMKVEAARAIARARGRGLKGLETTAPSLRKLLGQDQPDAVRLALAQALVALDDRDAAAALLQVAQAGSRDLRDVVEPALARWGHRPAREVWLLRLNDPATPHRDLVRAVQALAVVGQSSAAGRLREMVMNPRAPGPVRLEAARALAVLRREGLEKDAARLAGESAGGATGRLLAATLLGRHSGDEAVRQLVQLGRDREPAVAAVAVKRLLEIDAKLLLELTGTLRNSGDANLRRLAVEVLRREPSEAHVRVLGEMLNDPDPAVRTAAGDSLAELASKGGLGKQVIATGTRMLGTSEWRALEQAGILLTRLNHKPASGRLVGLLTADRPEVFVTAAWGLRKLAVPETLPAVVDYAAAELKRLDGGTKLPGRALVPSAFMDHQLSQLNQLLGQLKHLPADATLRRFLPRKQSTTYHESRAAAIWALGLLHEGKAPADLASALEARLNDLFSIPPEDERVRRMSAITLGRMKAKTAIPSLQTHYSAKKPTGHPVNDGCGWALARINGEVFPAPEPARKLIIEGFLIPRDAPTP